MNTKDVDTWNALVVGPWGLAEFKAETYSFRHRSHRYVSRLDRVYITDDAGLAGDLGATWRVTQPILVSSEVSDHQPVWLRRWMDDEGDSPPAKKCRIPSWVARHQQFPVGSDFSQTDPCVMQLMMQQMAAMPLGQAALSPGRGGIPPQPVGRGAPALNLRSAYNP